MSGHFIVARRPLSRRAKGFGRANSVTCRKWLWRHRGRTALYKCIDHDDSDEDGVENDDGQNDDDGAD